MTLERLKYETKIVTGFLLLRGWMANPASGVIFAYKPGLFHGTTSVLQGYTSKSAGCYLMNSFPPRKKIYKHISLSIDSHVLFLFVMLMMVKITLPYGSNPITLYSHFLVNYETVQMGFIRFRKVRGLYLTITKCFASLIVNG